MGLGRSVLWVLAVFLLTGVALHAVRVSEAASAQEIDIKADAALQQFRDEVPAGEEFLQAARGVLVIPEVTKAALIVGGEYGEGVLRIGGESVEYYRMAAGSVGLQIGGQVSTLVMVFLTDAALAEFRQSDGWTAGVTGQVAVIRQGAGTTVDTETHRNPVAAFVFGNKGLMVDASLEGAKFTRIEK